MSSRKSAAAAGEGSSAGKRRGRPPKSQSSAMERPKSKFQYHLLKKPKYLCKDGSNGDSRFSTPSASRASSPQGSEESRPSTSRRSAPAKAPRSAKAAKGRKSTGGRGRGGNNRKSKFPRIPTGIALIFFFQGLSQDFFFCKNISTFRPISPAVNLPTEVIPRKIHKGVFQSF